jgi:hypothetical protein
MRAASSAMKVLIAYTLVAVGIPYLAGLLIGRIFTIPVAIIRGLFRQPTDKATQAREFMAATAWSLRGPIDMPLPDRIVHVCMDVFNGFGAVVTAGFVFHLFGLSPSVSILAILAAWQFFFTITYKQALRALLGDLAGIVIGWFVILWLFSAA